jgi:glycerol-1-phosphate dehydrogenase [NAD(P)+]
MSKHPEVYIEKNVLEEFLDFIHEEGYNAYFLVCDKNTFPVLGEQILEGIRGRSQNVLVSNLDPQGLISDEVALSRVFALYDGKPRLFISVGSGTITDLTRFVSHKSQNPFVCFPTAASVDAYATHNAPVTIGGIKKSVNCQSPIAIFADLDAITNAPSQLTSSGFADLLSKFTSAADWQITHHVWGADYSASIGQRVLKAANAAVDSYQGLMRHDPECFADLIQGQFESGFCMTDFGNSMPASGGEHHIAHIWEMLAHKRKLSSIYHGNAVGVATIFEAAIFEKIQQTTEEELQTILASIRIPTRSQQEKELKAVLPCSSKQIIDTNPIYWQLANQELLDPIKLKLLKSWEDIRKIAHSVPKAEEFRHWISKMGGPISVNDLGLNKDEFNIGLEFGHYMRERFSVNLLRKLFKWKIEEFI